MSLERRAAIAGAATVLAVAVLAVALVGAPGLAGAVAQDTVAGPGPASSTVPEAAAPGADDAIVARIRMAVLDHDLDYFEKQLVDWNGARARTQRLTLFQIRECFGRPIKSVGLERLKPDPAAPLVPDGYRTNLPVTHLLRIAFDEKHPPEETPACVFMLSKAADATYRMALVLPAGAPPK